MILLAELYFLSSELAQFIQRQQCTGIVLGSMSHSSQASLNLETREGLQSFTANAPVVAPSLCNCLIASWYSFCLT